MFHDGPNVIPDGPHLVPDGPNMDPYGVHMVLYGSHMGPERLRCLYMVRDGPSQFHYGTYLLIGDPDVVLKWSSHGPLWSPLPTEALMVPDGPYMVIEGPHGVQNR